MKKWIPFILLLCIIPLNTFAKSATKEDLLTEIDKIENVQVDDNTEILSTIVTNNFIQLELLENDLPELRNINYDFKENEFIFWSGEVERKVENIIDVKEPYNNQYAFYLYSILESMSTAPYEEENYYNNTQIQKILENPKFNADNYYQNTGKTFGLSFKEKNKNSNMTTYIIQYHYYLDGEDTILIQYSKNNQDTFTNPSTGNSSFFITISLIVALGLLGYSCWNPKEKEKRV